MPQKKYAIHGIAKNKKAHDTHPIAHVWADDEAGARKQGELITRSNPIHMNHFSEGVEVKEVGQ